MFNKYDIVSFVLLHRLSYLFLLHLLSVKCELLEEFPVSFGAGRAKTWQIRGSAPNELRSASMLDPHELTHSNRVFPVIMQ